MGGLETPIEVFALATRNIFELYLRLKCVLGDESASQQWRDEAVTDQLEIYERILSLAGPGELLPIRSEVERVRQHAKERGLADNASLQSASSLAAQAGLAAEYRAFFKLYSKFVHPSSFIVNWPDAASSPMYRSTFSFNAQTYGLFILKEVQKQCGLPLPTIYETARARLEKSIS